MFARPALAAILLGAMLAPAGASHVSEGTTSAGLARRAAFAALRVGDANGGYLGLMYIAALEGRTVETLRGEYREAAWASFVWCTPEGACTLRHPVVERFEATDDGVASLDAADPVHGTISVSWSPVGEPHEDAARRARLVDTEQGYEMEMHYDLSGFNPSGAPFSGAWFAFASGAMGSLRLDAPSPQFTSAEVSLRSAGTVHLDWAHR